MEIYTRMKIVPMEICILISFYFIIFLNNINIL